MDDRLQIFNNGELGSLELLLEDEKVYFPATECAKILGYINPRKAIIAHCKRVTKRDSPTVGGVQEINYILEGDLYRLIIRSKLPAAEKFEHWVFDDVLPTIRKYGMYATDNLLEQMIAKPEIAIDVFKEIKAEHDKHKELEKENRHNRGLIALMVCKVSYYDKILQSNNSIPVSKIAKDYGMTAIAFNHLLHNLCIQYPISDTWLLYKKYANKGYAHSYTYNISSDKTVVHTNWTQKGRLFIYNLLKAKNILPIIERNDVCESANISNRHYIR